MHIHVVTLFPELVVPYTQTAIIGRAVEQGTVNVSVYNPRDYTDDPHRRVDDVPYGGGPGMVLQALPILRAVAAARVKSPQAVPYILAARGIQFSNAHAQAFAHEGKDIILICGRYEGIDARVTEILQATELSIGPYVLTGGELPALVVLDAVARRLPGVLGDAASIEEERTASRNVYTRPESFVYEGTTYTVPDVLRSGDHQAIEAWRREQ